MKDISKSIWIDAIKPNPAAIIRLFCFPHAGGSSMTYRGWGKVLSSKIEICPVNLPGRYKRIHEAPYDRISPLIDALAKEFQLFQELPFAFFGHSMGALIAFELARRLRREKQPGPTWFFASGRPAPQIIRNKPLIHNLPEDEFIKEVMILGGTPKELLQDQDLLKLFLPILRADFAINETYQYYQEEPLDCPITAYGGLKDKSIKKEETELWKKQTNNDFLCRMFPGDHFFINSNQDAVLNALNQDLSNLIRIYG